MAKLVNKGLFLTFEGGEGSGKSTQSKRTGEWLESQGCEVVWTREPGGTDLGKILRQLVLENQNPPLSPRAELFLYEADRAQHVDTIILPALSQGKVVICDRFAESALVYQGICRNLGLTQVEALNKFATNGLRPDKIFLLDIPEKMGLARVQKRLGSQQLDRMEQEGLAFHKQVRNGFLKLSKKEPKRFVVLDALLEAEEIEKRIRETLIPIIKKKNLCRH